jgi:hypothetical protein
MVALVSLWRVPGAEVRALLRVSRPAAKLSMARYGMAAPYRFKD